MTKVCLLTIVVTSLIVVGCSSDDDPSSPSITASNIPSALAATYGSYDINYSTQISKIGGPPQAPIDKAAATIEVRASEPGVIGVDPGTQIPGVDPEDVIFGAAYAQNPVHVFMGTDTADQHGDFGLWSSVRIGLPPGAAQLRFDGCEGEGFFGCSPVFFENTESTDSVNLLYYCVNVTKQTNGDIVFAGFLADDHRSEAAAANGFGMLVDHDILGQFVDQFVFDEGATFSFTISGDSISGTVWGIGRSIIGSEPDAATFTMTFGGRKAH